ncbi:MULTISPECIES: hypothetical protein [unclassified Moorena]|uniref:hypothetical protein n=1 Tax=unclassified Moorena TaxID=2683338 RepID=UPI001400A7DF|nr:MULTISPECIES: hypothetical protein [unclassified Moorena]NEO11180.1 hypothetical protein [Moorena sp. SIO3E8]NEQ00115.1 hypothetical protein [Moorena sp. SIO3F7]
MSKATLQYTTKDLEELGFIVEVPGRTDNARNRAKALDEIQRRMEDSEDTTVNEDSFADGLSADDLILVEPLATGSTDGEEAEIIQSVKAIASLASLRVNLEQAYQQAVELRPVIEALFSPDPLTPEHMKLATDRNFAKTLTKFAEAKAAHDQYLPIAEEAWKILEPALPPSQHQANPLGSDVVEHTESNGKKGVTVNES